MSSARNIFRTERLDAFVRRLRQRHLAAAFVRDEADLRGLIGFGCDNASLVVRPQAGGAYDVTLYTDFRYIPAAKRLCAGLTVRDFKKMDEAFPRGARLGYEGIITAADYRDLVKDYRQATFVDVHRELLLLRAVKTPGEIAGVAAAEALNDRIWTAAQAEFRIGMTEKDLQRIVRAYMNALGDGEAFETIVCVGKNAAECHHVPDDTVWHGEPLLVDMGVKLNGWCSDMTRCLRGNGGADAAARRRYDAIYALVLKANRAAIAACRPGMTGKALDKVARDIIRKAGHGKDFGHSLGHGVGLEIHEWPVASGKSATVLKPGMIVTIEPGVYVEGDCGVRIEDLVLVTRDGCEVLSHSAK